MVRSRRLAAFAVAMTVPLMGMVAAAGPAGAKSYVAGGSITCTQVSQTFSFNPPLVSSVAGSAGHTFEKITISPAQISGCSGTTTPSGAVPYSGSAQRPTVLKLRGTKINGVWYAGSCLALVTFNWSSKNRPHFIWRATGLTVKPSKVSQVYGSEGSNSSNEIGFIFNGVATGSFAGPVQINDFFNPGSSSALTSCMDAGPPVASLTTDSSNSSIKVG
jgi:hypothetical protein